MSCEFSVFLLCSETSEVLQYTASEAEDVEKVRVCCMLFVVVFVLKHLRLKHEENTFF